MRKISQQRGIALLFVASTSLALAACGASESASEPQAALPVSVVTVGTSDVDIADELPGRVVAYRVAEIRPQVAGIIQRRLFQQGSEVREGQPLFQINAMPFQADVDSARASVERANATLARARLQEERLAPLMKADAISGQSYDDAVAARRTAQAELAQARADLRRKNVDLGFSIIRSPISGRIDQAVFTEGALASVSDANPLATVQQIDRVYVDVRQPASRLEALRAAARAGAGNQGAPVELLSADGRSYPVKGTLLFSGVSVDPGTGQVIARVEFANPDRQLLPGMFVRAKLPRLHVAGAMTVPQQAVTHDATGTATVNVVGNGGKVSQRTVTTGDEQNGSVLITSGLKRGETVIVEGADRLQPGITVKPVAWSNPAAKR